MKFFPLITILILLCLLAPDQVRCVLPVPIPTKHGQDGVHPPTALDELEHQRGLVVTENDLLGVVGTDEALVELAHGMKSVGLERLEPAGGGFVAPP